MTARASTSSSCSQIDNVVVVVVLAWMDHPGEKKRVNIRDTPSVGIGRGLLCDSGKTTLFTK